jgi:hypothetical protein
MQRTTHQARSGRDLRQVFTGRDIGRLPDTQGQCEPDEVRQRGQDVREVGAQVAGDDKLGFTVADEPPGAGCEIVRRIDRAIWMLLIGQVQGERKYAESWSTRMEA